MHVQAEAKWRSKYTQSSFLWHDKGRKEYLPQEKALPISGIGDFCVWPRKLEVTKYFARPISDVAKNKEKAIRRAIQDYDEALTFHIPEVAIIASQTLRLIAETSEQVFTKSGKVKIERCGMCRSVDHKFEDCPFNYLK